MSANERQATAGEQTIGIETLVDGYLPDTPPLWKLEDAELEAAKTVRIGAPATICMYSDRHGGTVVRVAKSFIEVSIDDAERTDKLGMSDYGQTYRFKPGKQVWRAYKHKDGTYQGRGFTVAIGVRVEKFDFGF